MHHTGKGLEHVCARVRACVCCVRVCVCVYTYVCLNACVHVHGMRVSVRGKCGSCAPREKCESTDVSVVEEVCQVYAKSLVRYL